MTKRAQDKTPLGNPLLSVSCFMKVLCNAYSTDDGCAPGPCVISVRNT